MNHPGFSPEHSASVPSVLLVGTNRWPLAARLASGFLALGSRVAAVGPVPGHPITAVRGFERMYRYAGQRPVQSLRVAIEDFAPDLIVPFCDRSVQHLHELYETSNPAGESTSRLRGIIERSLGPSSSYPIVSSRYNLLMLARDAGIRVPSTVQVESIEDLKNSGIRAPWLLKASGTWGGSGVRRAETLGSGERALRELTSKTSPLQLAKQLLLNRDRDWTLSNPHRPRPEVIAQAIVTGRPANCAVVCWKGELIAGIAVEVAEADGPCRPAIVVQVVHGSEMLDAAKWIARRLQLTGFFGLDFMIEDLTNHLYLIEMNPRCTPPCSLNLGGERDLVAAIWARLADHPMPQRQPDTQKTRIAYFPQAIQRNLDSMESYLDVPNGEPELVQELLHPWSERSWIGKLLDLSRRTPSATQAPASCVFKVPKFQEAASVPQRELA